MLEDVGQRLLDDAVCGHIHRCWQGRVVTADGQADLQARGAQAAGQRWQLAYARLRGAVGLLIWLAQDAERAAGFNQGLPSAVLNFLQGHRVSPASGPCPCGVQHDHAEMVGDDVVQFPGDPGPLGRHGLLGLALHRGVPRDHRDGSPAAADQGTSQPERRNLQKRQCHARTAVEQQPQPAVLADLVHDGGGEDQAGGRAAQAGVRAQRVGGGEQHERGGVPGVLGAGPNAGSSGRSRASR